MSPVNPLRVVVIEDDEDDFLLLRQTLRSMGTIAVAVRWAQTYEEGDALLGKEHDVALIDYRLGPRDGLDLIRARSVRGHRTPMILLTGVGDRAVDVRAMEAGAADYLVKDEVTAPVLERAMRYAVARKAAEGALKESESCLEQSVSLLRATLDCCNDGILVTDSRGSITECSRSFKSLWGLPEAASREEVAAHFNVVRRLMKQQRHFLARIRHIQAHSELVTDDLLELKGERYIERHSRPQRSGDRIIGRVWSFRDVTEQRKLQAAVVASDRLASMGALAAGVAHEINNPLTYLLANLSVLTEEIRLLGPVTTAESGAELLQMLADARYGAERLRKIVRELKLFSRAEDVPTGPVDLEAVLDSSINMAFHEIRHRARLIKAYGSDVPLVEGNEGKLGQVFLNLIMNAAQAMTEGRAHRNELGITSRRDDQGRAVVEVRDTGEGIAPGVLDQIFDPFFTTKPRGTGTGLGLSISQSIITALGGTIEVESEVGKGSVFRVSLPAAAAGQVAHGSVSNESWPARSRGKVLVVDDDPRIGTALQRILGREHHVVAVGSGAAALTRMAEGDAFDVILCDLMMPNMTGMDLHAQLCALSSSSVDQMVFMTAGAFTRDAREFLERVPNQRVEKPLDPGVLRSLVRRLVDGSS